MADETPSETTNERRMTTDSQRIREWAEKHEAVPVSSRGGEGPGYSFVHQEAVGPDHQEYTWEEFTEAFEADDRVFIYHERAAGTHDEGLGYFEFVDRDGAFQRADLGRDEFEDSLRRGETVTTEIVETQVVETEVVERDTVESEVVESDLTERTIVESDLVRRDVVETEFIDDEIIEVTVDENRIETIEEVEHYTVESEVVDVDVEQHDELERDTIETDVELESVQRSILESEVVRSDVTPDEIVDQEVIRSKRTEGDAVQSELVERRVIEEELDETRTLRFVLESEAVVTAEVVDSKLIDGEIVDVEEYTGTESMAAENAASDMDVSGETTADTGTGMETEPAADTTIELSADDEGKDVVDEAGQQIGIVATVDGQTAYVDPQPGLADRFKARLGWGDHSGDEYPIERAQVADVTEDEVVIRGSEPEHDR